MAGNHVMYLGKLIGNLHSLEIALRVFLDRLNPVSSSHLPADKSYYQFQIGDSVPENVFTNFDTLGDLVDKYNAVIHQKNPDLLVDRGVVQLLDLMAHGRVSADAPDETRLAIIKFDRPHNGSVRVADCALMTEQWFQGRIEFVLAQLEKVAQAST
jgi:hypothetical protein